MSGPAKFQPQITKWPVTVALLKPLFSMSLSSIKSPARVAVKIPKLAWKLVERFLPGGLTLILWKSEVVSNVVCGGQSKVAVRIPDHPVPISLIRMIESPLIGTSANLSGRPNPITAEEVHEQLGDSIDAIIDGGRCPGGIGSTVVDITESTPKIIREGIISTEEVVKALEEG